MKKKGRPKLENTERRKSKVLVSYNERELDEIKRRAAEAGKTEAVFVREASLSSEAIRVIPHANREAVSQLRNIGTLLNQIAKGVNEGKTARVDPRYFEEVGDVLKAVKREFLGYADSENNNGK